MNTTLNLPSSVHSFCLILYLYVWCTCTLVLSCWALATTACRAAKAVDNKQRDTTTARTELWAAASWEERGNTYEVIQLCAEPRFVWFFLFFFKMTGFPQSVLVHEKRHASNSNISSRHEMLAFTRHFASWKSRLNSNKKDQNIALWSVTSRSPGAVLCEHVWSRATDLSLYTGPILTHSIRAHK